MYEDGQVFRCTENDEIKMSFNSKTYYQINYVDVTRRKSAYVHRVIAQEFVENPENKPFVNHKNGNKHDNNAKNLEWVTARENVIHAYRHGLMHNKNFGRLPGDIVGGQRI